MTDTLTNSDATTDLLDAIEMRLGLDAGEVLIDPLFNVRPDECQRCGIDTIVAELIIDDEDDALATCGACLVRLA